jgi:hypothetical protein
VALGAPMLGALARLRARWQLELLPPERLPRAPATPATASH